MEQLQEFTAPNSPTAEGAGAGLTPQQLSAAVSSCAASLAKGFDKEQGGFGPAPKFPRPSEINLMFRAALQAQVGACRRVLGTTLVVPMQRCRGGMCKAG
jgi:uncharacterized protein YyaL (SSP411 family)